MQRRPRPLPEYLLLRHPDQDQPDLQVLLGQGEVSLPNLCCLFPEASWRTGTAWHIIPNIRIFNHNGKNSLRLISPGSQLFICSGGEAGPALHHSAGLILLQLVGVVAWLVLEPPNKQVGTNCHLVPCVALYNHSLGRITQDWR
jgi:hypothetical protein